MLASGRSSFILKHYFYEIPYWIFIFVLFILVRYAGLEEAFPDVQIYRDRDISYQFIIAIAGGIIFLGEPMTLRLLVASVAILGGIALVILKKR